MRLLLLLIVPASLCAQSNKTAWKWSVTTLAAGTTVDILSSRGQHELNPILGRGEFGRQQVVIKVGVTAGAVLLQHYVIGRLPKATKWFTRANLVLGGGMEATAVVNRLR